MYKHRGQPFKCSTAVPERLCSPVLSVHVTWLNLTISLMVYSVSPHTTLLTIYIMALLSQQQWQYHSSTLTTAKIDSTLTKQNWRCCPLSKPLMASWLFSHNITDGIMALLSQHHWWYMALLSQQHWVDIMAILSQQHRQYHIVATQNLAETILY